MLYAIAKGRIIITRSPWALTLCWRFGKISGDLIFQGRNVQVNVRVIFWGEISIFPRDFFSVVNAFLKNIWRNVRGLERIFRVGNTASAYSQAGFPVWTCSYCDVDHHGLHTQTHTDRQTTISWLCTIILATWAINRLRLVTVKYRSTSLL